LFIVLLAKKNAQNQSEICIVRAGLSKCGARLETILRGPA